MLSFPNVENLDRKLDEKLLNEKLRQESPDFNQEGNAWCLKV